MVLAAESRGGVAQAPKKQELGSECGCASAVRDAEAGGRWRAGPTKMAEARAAGETWATAAAEAAARLAGLLPGGSGGRA